MNNIHQLSQKIIKLNDKEKALVLTKYYPNNIALKIEFKK